MLLCIMEKKLILISSLVKFPPTKMHIPWSSFLHRQQHYNEDAYSLVKFLANLLRRLRSLRTESPQVRNLLITSTPMERSGGYNEKPIGKINSLSNLLYRHLQNFPPIIIVKKKSKWVSCFLGLEIFQAVFLKNTTRFLRIIKCNGNEDAYSLVKFPPPTATL